MKLKMHSLSLVLSLSALSFAAQAQNVADNARTTSGKLTVAASGTESISMTYKVTSDPSEDVTLDLNLSATNKPVGLNAKIFNAEGKEVLSSPLNLVNGHLVKVLNTSELAPGIYVIELAGTGHGDIAQQFRLIKGPGGVLVEKIN